MRVTGFNYSLYARNNAILSLFGGNSNNTYNSIYSSLSQHASVKSGAYSKALKAYYAAQKADTTKKKTEINKDTKVNEKDIISKDKKNDSADLVKPLNRYSSRSALDTLLNSRSTYSKNGTYYNNYYSGTNFNNFF